VVTLNGLAEADVLDLAGSLEQVSSHPLAQAIVERARDRGIALHSPLTVRETAGRGIRGSVDGKDVLVGSESFVGAVGIDVGQYDDAAARMGVPADASTTLVAVNERPAGLIAFDDPLRPGIDELLTRLQALGLKDYVMLTGDDLLTAESVALEAGILSVRANLLPQDKASAVAEIERSGPAAMVGDGINDAPALATASVGVALGARGAAVSGEAADIVLTTDNLERLADAVEIGRHTVSIARQSIIAGMGLSLVMMSIAAGGGIPPAVGALMQEGVDVAVILNALRAR